MKRFFYLFTIIAAIGIVVLIGYFIRYRSEVKKGTLIEEDLFTSSQTGLPSIPLPSKPPSSQEGILPPAAQTQTSTSSASAIVIPPGTTPVYSQFSAIAENPIADYAIDENNNVSLIQPDGQIVKIVNKKSVILSSATVANLRQATFSPDAQKVFVIFGDLQNLQANIFDLSTQTWRPLPQGITSAAWSPDSQKIAYLIKQLGQTVLTILENDSKSKPQEVLKFYAEDLVLSWPSKNQILLYQKPSALAEGSLWSFDIEKKTLSLIVDKEKGLETLYEPITDFKLLFVANDYNRKGGVLKLKQKEGPSRTLSFLTLPYKCVFELKTNNSTTTQSSNIPEVFLDCAIPQDTNKFSRSLLPDDYYKKAIFTSDNFYRINLISGEMKVIYSDIFQNLDAQNLKISNGQLFFVNRFDQKLYVFPLPPLP